MLKTKHSLFLLNSSITSWGGNGIAYWPCTWYACPWANMIGAFTAAAEFAICLGLYESVSPLGGD